MIERKICDNFFFGDFSFQQKYIEIVHIYRASFSCRNRYGVRNEM